MGNRSEALNLYNEELEEVLGKRCYVIQEQMQEEIRDLTNYHWLGFAA
ncbi:Mobile element protein [Geitlerinema sp. FC II]|nr:hypothetical protein [Geitlerinema sp. CS-897]PPT06054.1 Mobile element protein [Geitlerinema sp. FC II]